MSTDAEYVNYEPEGDYDIMAFGAPGRNFMLYKARLTRRSIHKAIDEAIDKNCSIISISKVRE